MIWCRQLPLLLFLLISLMACSITEVVNSKPSTSAPSNPKNVTELYDACYDLQQKIDAWARDQERKIEDEWLEGERDLLQASLKASRFKDEVLDMKAELNMNCNIKHAEDFPGPTAPNVGGVKRNR